jgi:predicted nucleotidyltransferase
MVQTITIIGVFDAKHRRYVEMLSEKTIRERVAPIAEKYDVAHIDIFGSYANGNATPESDVDFLVEFSAAVPSIFKVMGFREEVTRSLGVNIDVVTLPLTDPKRLSIDNCVRII